MGTPINGLRWTNVILDAAPVFVGDRRQILAIYPFAFPCKDMFADTVISNLLSLFSLFGSPGSIHSDRGTQFESKKLHDCNRMELSKRAPPRTDPKVMANGKGQMGPC